MKKPTKGALAAGAAAVLLLGGAGSLAYWTDVETFGGDTIGSGTLALAAADCAAWTFDDGEPTNASDEGELTNASIYGPGSAVVPGDVLTTTCSYTITAKGDHLRATVEASTSGFVDDADFDGNLSVEVADIAVNGTSATEFTEVNDGQDLTVQLEVAFDGEDTESQALSAELDKITVTAKQIHS
jgi:alternate signal-mediated exported protein